MKIKELHRRTILGIALITIGVAIIATAFYMNYLGRSVNQAMIQEFENLPNLELMPRNSIDEESTTPESADVMPVLQNNTKAVAKPTLKVGGRTIAIITIPRINLKAAVGQGVDTATLNYSIGHFENTAMPGTTGNFCVAGHRNYLYNEFFRRLDELKAGDVVIVTTKAGEFRYKVTTSKVVAPEEVSVLNPTKKPTITMVTCTPVSNPTHRLIVKGDLVQN